MKRTRKVEFYTANCPICGDEFSRPMDLVMNSLKKGAKKIVCSKECGALSQIKANKNKGEEKPIAEV